MGVNLVIVDGDTKIDLTTDTVTADKLQKGTTAHNAAGDQITGELEPLDTSDATATAAQILKGSTAYVNGEKLTGEMVNRGELNYALTKLQWLVFPGGYYSGVQFGIDSTEAAKVISSNIKKNVSILGVTGTLEEGGFSVERETNEGGGETVTIEGVEDNWEAEMRSRISTMVVSKFPSDLTTIASYAFTRCTVKPTSLPDTVTTIAGGAFERATVSFTSLPESVRTIGSYAFNGASGLALTSLPSSLTSIGNYAFYNCYELAITEIPAGVTSVGTSAFTYCTSLTSITFKGTPNFISSSGFSGISGLTDIYVPWSEGAVDGAPWGASNATIHYDYAV